MLSRQQIETMLEPHRNADGTYRLSDIIPGTGDNVDLDTAVSTIYSLRPDLRPPPTGGLNPAALDAVQPPPQSLLGQPPSMPPMPASHPLMQQRQQPQHPLAGRQTPPPAPMAQQAPPPAPMMQQGQQPHPLLGEAGFLPGVEAPPPAPMAQQAPPPAPMDPTTAPTRLNPTWEYTNPPVPPPPPPEEDIIEDVPGMDYTGMAADTAAEGMEYGRAQGPTLSALVRRRKHRGMSGREQRAQQRQNAQDARSRRRLVNALRVLEEYGY